MHSQPIDQARLMDSGIQFANSIDVYPALHQPGDAGLPLLLVDNGLGRAVIALQGAHVLAFQPKGEREMLWVSPRCVLESGKPIRGGIPLCLPWFGPGTDGKSMHGFARTTAWTVVDAQTISTGATRLAFELEGNASTNALWPHAFKFRFDVLVGSVLTLGLTIENHSDVVAPLAFAFHTYFAVDDVAKTRVVGLDDTFYIDKLDNLSRRQQQGEVSIPAAMDRIYLDVPAVQTLKMHTHAVRIDSDAHCAVVWNAGVNDRNMPDIGAGNHVGYLCVERGDVAERAIALQPGATHRNWMTLAVDAE